MTIGTTESLPSGNFDNHCRKVIEDISKNITGARITADLALTGIVLISLTVGAVYHAAVDPNGHRYQSAIPPKEQPHTEVPVAVYQHYGDWITVVTGSSGTADILPEPLSGWTVISQEHE